MFLFNYFKKSQIVPTTKVLVLSSTYGESYHLVAAFTGLEKTEFQSIYLLFYIY